MNPVSPVVFVKPQKLIGRETWSRGQIELIFLWSPDLLTTVCDLSRPWQEVGVGPFGIWIVILSGGVGRNQQLHPEIIYFKHGCGGALQQTKANWNLRVKLKPGTDLSLEALTN